MRTAIALIAASSLLALGGCGTTGSRSGTMLASTPASADDCAVVGATLELFSRPLDGTGLKVMALAAPESPSFMPQRPEQRASGAISLRDCPFIDVQLVSQGPAVILGRPEIHDDTVIVSYQDPGSAPVHAVLERTRDGHWRHTGALLTAPR